jgi:chromosome partitioning protein
MQRIVVLNPKGGSGKTTLAINLAAYFAARGDNTLLIDRDPQGSSTRWLRKRKVPQPAINGIATFERDSRTTMSWQMRVPEGTEKIIVDSPAAIEARTMPELTRDAGKVIVPVLPSDIDIHAASRCIADLLLVAKIKRAENRIGVVANRVRKNTLMFQSLMRFLEKLDIPVIATIRDSQNYVRAAEQGVGIHEMKPYTVKEDLAQWESLLAWLEPERALAEQPAPLQEQPAPEALPTATEEVLEPATDETGAHDARFLMGAAPVS